MKYFIPVLAIAVAGCSALPLYTKECAELGITKDDPRFINCVAWREQVHIERGQASAAAQQNLWNAVGVLSQMGQPHYLP